MMLFDFVSGTLLNRGPEDPPLLLEGATLVDGTGAAPAEDSTVLVSGDRIVAVNEELDAGIHGGPMRIDLRDRWIMPGLVDAHVHLDGSSTADPYRRHLSDPRGTRMLRAARHASQMLATGCTTIRDVGSPFGPGVRRAFESGVAHGPRVVASGPMITATDGGGDPRVLPSVLTRDHRLGFGIADGVEECAQMVRRNLREGADVVSVMLRGGLVGEQGMMNLGPGPEFSRSELNVMCEEAHRRGLMVSAHAPGMESLLLALECGVDTIEHPSAEVDESLMTQFKNAATCIVTTVDAFRRSGLVREASEAVGLVLSAISAGVPVALGSACSGAARVSLADEIAALLEAGVEVASLISAATLGGARALGIADRVGTIAPGMLSDILVLDFDPYQYPERLGTTSGLAQIIKSTSGHSGLG
jgi:imidazolonepropionase-like amidohydrolase